MKKILIVTLFFSSVHFVHAQNGTQPTGSAAERNLEELGSGSYDDMVMTFDNRYEGVKGSPYLFDTWQEASIYTPNSVYKNVSVKYNVLDNILLFKGKGEKELILDADKITYFIFTDGEGNNKSIYKKLGDIGKSDKSLANKFVLLTFEGDKANLVNLKGKNIIKADYKGGYSSGKKYDEIVDKNTYYYVDRSKAVHKVKLNKKNLLNVLRDKQSEIKNYISKEKVDVSTEEGWVKVLAYYEKL